MNRVLVIGGTGNVGRHVLSQLSAKGAQGRALTRKPDASRLPPQIPLVRRDPALPETLDSCLQTSTRYSSCGPPLRPLLLPRCSASRSMLGATFSFPPRTKHRARSSNSPIRPRQIERLIENSGLQWTVLRPGMFAATFCAGGLRRFVPATSCAGPHLPPPLQRLTSET
jgi:hypothetical protein